eukprot:scaffold23417_cov71-Phaeocystis_antarctica.AAC.7
MYQTCPSSLYYEVCLIGLRKFSSARLNQLPKTRTCSFDALPRVCVISARQPTAPLCAATITHTSAPSSSNGCGWSWTSSVEATSSSDQQTLSTTEVEATLDTDDGPAACCSHTCLIDGARLPFGPSYRLYCPLGAACILHTQPPGRPECWSSLSTSAVAAGTVTVTFRLAEVDSAVGAEAGAATGLVQELRNLEVQM